MQTAFCTNCGQPLAAGAVFCAQCGTRVEAPSAPPASTAYSGPSATPPYTPPQNQNQSRGWVGWVVGCLTAFLAVIALLIGLVVFGLLTHHLIFFAIGLGGLVLLIFIGAIIEHQIRRLYRRAKYGLERDIGMGNRPYNASSRYGAGARSNQQPQFSLIRFIFSLVIMAALIYGGLYLYYSQQFVGSWSGVLTIGSAQQGISANLQISLAPHGPSSGATFSDPASLAVTQVQFKQATAQACKGTPATYQLSGTASRLDASDVSMTLNTGAASIPLTGAYTNGTFTLSGKNAQGQTVTLTLQRGADQDGYSAACGS